ncbi:MAG: hypothetical protein KKD01_19705 [Proteobacteria bacterium]|nr:hypothetical protein [Pseudomonadota bacterium]
MRAHVPHQDQAQPEPPTTEAICPEAEDPERLAYLDGLKVQIRKGVYRPDIRDLARSLASMLVRDL